MTSRYLNRTIAVNDSEEYRDIFKERGVEYLRHFTTPTLNYPTPTQIASLSIVPYVWGSEDRLWKLAETHYGNPTKSWIIAFFNRKPTEAHIEVGDTILVPLPLGKIEEFIGV